jgi:hypothetical protein
MAFTADKPPAASEPEKPKSAWDSVLTSTPVVLTIVATLLAGLSSSEMTRAQYFRALAAQHQSKAGDQWNFFQAKRVRGTMMENTVAMLHALAEPGAVTPAAIAENADALVRDLERLEKEAERLLQASSAARADLGSEGEPLQRVAEKLRETAKSKVSEARTLKRRLNELLAQAGIKEALGYLNTESLPELTKVPIGDRDIQEAHKAIGERKPETETAPLMARIREEQLIQALENAENNAVEFDKLAKPIDKALGRVAALLAEELILTASVHRAAGDVAMALTGLSTSKGNALADVRAAGAAVAHTDAELDRMVKRGSTDFKAAQRSYTSRRYEREARDNQEIANVYEIQVRKSSWNSERHRARSVMFFYGMLAAQAGVTIATLSLAVRQRSLLWSLATLAGFGAIFFSAYVYLYT